jgi:hypothetical protein
MIRFKRLSPALLNSWLVSKNLPESQSPRYRLRLWREDPTGLAAIKAELIDYLDEAFDDARKRLRKGFEDSLSPFVTSSSDPAANYPAMLHQVTLQGYLGETLAVLAVEHWGAAGHMDWVVPAFLFRLHDQEFQHLELINQRLAAGEAYDPNAEAEQRPGRTGDDGLAFRINDQNIITDILTLEAKCVGVNRPEKIKEAHEKLAAGSTIPSGIRELINILDEYNSSQAQTWKQALLQLRASKCLNATHYDGIAYACGAIPQQVNRISWMKADIPHPSYTAQRHLEGMEFQLNDLPSLIDTLYRGN